MDGPPCKRCGNTERYPPRPDKSIGACVSCARARQVRPEALEKKRRVAATPKYREKINARRATPTYRERLREQRRQRGTKPRDKRTHFFYCLWSKYRMTEGQWNRLLITQAGRCAICNSPLTGSQDGLDHCHEATQAHGRGSGNRGLLCWPCNLFQAKVDADPEGILARVQAALAYREDHRRRHGEA